jgi:hypothetical protein
MTEGIKIQTEAAGCVDSMSIDEKLYILETFKNESLQGVII